MPSRKALFNAAHSLKRITLDQGPQAAQAALNKRGQQLSPQQRAQAEGIINKYSTVPEQGFNYGGMVPPEEEERRKLEEALKSKQRIAKTQIREQKLAERQGNEMMGKPAAGEDPLKQIGMELGKKALMSALGPLGSVAGMFFNEGGNVPMQGYNTGGWLSALFGKNPNRQKMEEEARRRKAAQQKSLGAQIGWPGMKRNMGGPISNPHGYNEGGQAMETPLKKVMEEDKIQLAREAFERAEARKDQKAKAEEMRAQKKFDMEMKLKKAAATTKTAPLASKK